MTPLPPFPERHRMQLGSDHLTIAADTPFQQTVRLLRRQSRKILLVAVAGAILAGIGGLLVPPRYAAKAEIVIQPQPVAAGQEAVALPPDQDQAVVETHLAALMSREHLQQVLDSLFHDPPTMPPPGTSVAKPDAIAWARAQLLAWLRRSTAQVTRPLMALLPALSTAHAPASADAKREPRLEAFQRHLLVYQERGSHAIGISFTGSNPYEAAAAANRVAQLYVDTLYRQKQETIDRALAWINRRIPELRVEVEHAEGAVQKYRVDAGLPEGGQIDAVDQKLTELSRQLTAAESDLNGQRAVLKSVAEQRSSGPGVDALAQILGSTSLRQLLDRRLELRQAASESLARLGPMHPTVQAATAQLDAVQAEIRQEVNRAAADVRAQAKLSELRIASLRERVGVAQRDSTAVHRLDVRLRDLEHSASTVRQVYEGLLQRREQLTERQEMISPDVRILSLATPPDRPSSPNPLLFTIPAFVAFLIGGGLVAAASDRLDQGLRSVRDVSDALGIHCVGLVPRLRRRGRQRPHQHLLLKPFSAYAEAIRSVVAALRLAAPHDIPEVVLVNSSVPREGKTTLAVSVVVTAALLGRRAILVDLDFRRPAILRELGRTAVPSRSDDSGLTVNGIQTITDLGIDILPVRGYVDNPLLAFARGELPALLDRLRARYDCIVIDSPPLLSVTEARLLATLADKILFVVQWGRTRRDLARNAIELLREARLLGRRDGEDVIAGVITQVDLTKHARYRYGDTGESLVRYARYYGHVPGRSRPRLPQRIGPPQPPGDGA